MAVTLKSGSWYIIHYTGEINPKTGKPKQKWIKCSNVQQVETVLNGRKDPKNKKEAERVERLFLTLKEQNKLTVSSNMKFFEFLDHWNENHIAVHYAPRTHVTYTNAILKLKEFHENSKINANPPLHEVNTTLIQAFVSFMIKENLSSRTIRAYVGAIRSSLAQAVEWDLIPHVGLKKIRMPMMDKKRPKALTPEQVDSIFKEMDMRIKDAKEKRKFEKEFELQVINRLFKTLFLTGARVGEICGLAINKIDLENEKIISIKQIAQRIPNVGVILKDSPKTASSVRDIPLGDNLIAILKEQIAYQKTIMMRHRNVYKDHGLVFCQMDGSPLDPDLAGRYFARVAKKLDIKASLHDLRHTFTTWQLRDGTNILDVSAILGHSDPSTTLSIYGHASSKEQRNAILSMDKKITV